MTGCSAAAAAALPYPPDTVDDVRSSAARCGRVAELSGRVGDDLAHDRRMLQGSWQGPASRACSAEMRAATSLVRSLAVPLRRAGGFLDEHAEVVRDARVQVDAFRREHDDLVAAQRARVDALRQGGDPAEPAFGTALRAALDAHEVRLAVLRRRHGAVLEHVAEHAGLTGTRVRRAAASLLPGGRSGRPVGDDEELLAGLLPLLASMRASAGVGCTPPAPGSPPEAVLTWWGALSSDEQQRMIARFPGAVGALDGLPSAARSQANELRLARDLATLRASGALTDDEKRWLRNCELVQQQLDRVRSEEDPFSLEPLEVQLLVFDPTAFGYEGRAAVVVGDLDGADNVAFLVPGLGSTVESAMSSLTSGALRVRQDARRLSPYETTATVAWMGYDAPDLGNVVVDDAAVHGARLLAADLVGAQAARAVPPHLTVIGHSYGSTTVGAMLRAHRTGTDDVVLVGSPGPDVEHAADLRVPGGHVFAGASSRDPVSYLDRFGKDPTHESFGAVRFQAEDPTRNSWRLDADDHSKYFNEGTESLANIVHVVTGDYGGVTQASYREEWWLLPDGINSDPEADREPTTAR